MNAVTVEALPGESILIRMKPRESPAPKAAIEFIRSQLADGPRPAREVHEAAREAGIPERALMRAKRQIGVTLDRHGGLGHAGIWHWHLREDS